MKILNVDVAIIGAGTAGMTAYRQVIRRGKTAVLIEDSHYGTTCARVGCMPSKLLISAADHRHAINEAPKFGINVDTTTVEVDGVAVMDRVKRERDRFVSFVVSDVEGFAADTKLWGTARFTGENTLVVGDHTQVQAKAFVIASGTSPRTPTALKALGDKLLTTDEIFYWDDLPKSIAILGTGVIGMEIGQALHRLGVKVTIINRSQRIAGIQDPKVAENARSVFSEEMDIRFDTQILRAERQGNDVQLSLQDQQGVESLLTVECVLNAAGRQPNIEKLNLAAAGINVDDKGKLRFNKHTLQVENKPVFLAGDVNGLHPMLHEAADDGRIAADNAVNWPTAPQAPTRRSPMKVVFSNPQVMAVGVAFADLPADVRIGEVSFTNQGRSRVMLENKGMLRVYADRHSDVFLGAEMVGPSAEHLAHLLAWSAQQQLTIKEMLGMPFYHPVVEEGLRTALRNTHSS
ncbi:dihydrolipoyl dehydrogenase [Paenalcaligenes suwonensis]|uniref:dihydrolipoyl dehydrogenase n=1 Tax=Paenalcaligenes suwonensis TaxID=1202713 RepID=UPI00140B839D|nr:dihydrolipoyl dehydrogenase [Paenalcaligenes suwonensis]NHC62451.1 dihydrolipoyl dehydrogenase [Paenalcaligenes suwonensis]